MLSLKKECFNALATIIFRNQKEKENLIIQEISNYVQKLPDFLLDELFSWIRNVQSTLLSSNNLAICFYPRKKTLWLKKTKIYFEIEDFLQISGKNISNLTKLRFPKWIFLSCFASQQLSILAPDLQIFNLRKTFLDIGCLKHLSTISLVEINLSRTHVSDIQLNLLLQKPLQKSLRILNTKNTPISPQGNASALECFTNLEELIMDDSTLSVLKLTSPNYVPSMLKNLIIGYDMLPRYTKKLHLTGELLTKCLTSLPIVKKVEFGLCHIMFKNFTNFELLKHVDHLTLTNVWFIQSDCVIVSSHIYNLLRENLKYLKLKWVDFEKYIEPVVLNFPKLESLKIVNSLTSTSSQYYNQFFTGTQNLVELKIIYCSNFTNSVVFESFVNDKLKHLKRLDLVGCENVKTSTIIFLIDKKSLTRLFIKLNRKMKQSLVGEKLKQSIHDWVIFKFYPLKLWIEKITV